MVSATSTTRSTRSQVDVVLDGIKTMIVSGRLGPGARLPVEKDLAAELGVSRGPLREGVRALAILGVLETRQGDGTYLTGLNPLQLLGPLGFLADLQLPANAGHLLAVRRVLETETVALAAIKMTDAELDEAGRILDSVAGIAEGELAQADLEAFIEADTQFHRLIARASGNPAFAAIIESLVGRTYRARLWRAIREHGAVSSTQAEHGAILAELRRHDPERAKIRMATHLLGVQNYADSHPDSDTHT